MNFGKIADSRKVRILLFICLLYSAQDLRAVKGRPPAGWEVLFDGKNIDKWISVNKDGSPSQGWAIEDGTLAVKEHKKGQDIITKETYGDFELVFDFKLTYSANSGIKYLVGEIKNNNTGKMDWNGPEYQIIDDYNHPEVKDHANDKGSTASLYLAYAPENKTLLPVGKWNSGKIIVKGRHIEHWLNGVKVVSCERGSPDFRDRMGATKFKEYDKYGELPEGHIMLTDHDGDIVYFRSIKIRRL
ncbi:MAG TPA: DUF1080 domain-containing protein [Puia sp.]